MPSQVFVRRDIKNVNRIKEKQLIIRLGTCDNLAIEPMLDVTHKVREIMLFFCESIIEIRESARIIAKTRVHVINKCTCLLGGSNSHSTTITSYIN